MLKITELPADIPNVAHPKGLLKSKLILKLGYLTYISKLKKNILSNPIDVHITRFESLRTSHTTSHSEDN